VFAPHTDLCATVSRLAQTVLYEHSTLHGCVPETVEPLSRLSVEVRGVLMEKMLDSLAEGLYRPEVAESMLDIGDVLIGLYDASSMPVRRAR